MTMTVTDEDRIRIARECYDAYRTGDRGIVETRMSEDLVFYSPPDPGIDRARYFERCWPGAGNIAGYEFKRLIAHGGEVIVTYEAARNDGSRFRNTEVLTFEGDKIRRVEVYFGWNVD
jgi:ketosteroid isomerase-like protein